MDGAGQRESGNASVSGTREAVAVRVVFLAAGLALAGAAHGGVFDGRLSLEMEYLGESYFSERLFTAEDLDLPSGTNLVVADTTRFGDDTWLPGQALELSWQSDYASRNRFRASSRSAANSERLSQDLEFTAEIPAGETGRWRFRARGSLRDDDRSLVGHGDWQTRLEAARETGVGGDGRGGLRLGWDHSRTRGDTTSYLYDYETYRGRLFLSRGTGWLPRLEAMVEGAVKVVPGGDPGGYREARAGGTWRDPGRVRSLNAEARIRNYTGDGGVGRDQTNLELEWRDRLLHRGTGSLHLESGAVYTDYAGEDDLYYDSLELDLRVLYRREGDAWTVFAGPAAEFLADLGDGERDYWQGTGRGSASRLFGTGGFLDMSVEAGYRDYRSNTSQVIEVASLSTSLLRSDYWLVEALALVGVPLFGGVTLDLVASTSWEFHTRESERILVTFATLGVGRTF